MIYFENYKQGTCGLNNHVIPYTLCISLSNFLGRDFFFDYELPPSTPPVFAVTGALKERFSILMNSPRSKVSDVVRIDNRRVYEIDRQVPNKTSIDDPLQTFVTTNDQKTRFGETMIWSFFSLGRAGLTLEELQSFDLIEVGSTSLVNSTFFFFLNKAEKNDLLSSIAIRYCPDIEKLAATIAREFGEYNSLHVRLGDFSVQYAPDGYSIDVERCKAYFAATWPDRETPILVATDELEEKELFGQLLKGFNYSFIDELIFDSYFDTFKQLEFTDFNVLSILNQLLCANGGIFIGTCRSTFTSVIHRLRQERFQRKDFNFLPDDRISRVLSPHYNIVPDSRGFFEWNLYSIFSEHYEYPSWMREWNYDMTSLP